jgi:2-polyprenyl-3-methyl-5-hydroxy-6-metoxy-1,4-benzoquinol methylase
MLERKFIRSWQDGGSPVTEPTPTPMNLPANCKVCDSQSLPFGEITVLRKYQVHYFRCPACGFIQTETPYWLNEAYSSAIAMQDVGIMQRNLLNQELTSAVLNLLVPEAGRCLDYGAGHGIFVRLMRDRGFDFRWYDSHATNDYAGGFEYEADQACEFLTAFEVLEHLTDPLADIAKIMAISENVFVSTLLVPEPAPKLSDWWYFVPSAGQHISFYTLRALQLVAKRFGRQLLSRGPYHLFTTTTKSETVFRLIMHAGAARILNRFFRHRSRIEADFRLMTQ